MRRKVLGVKREFACLVCAVAKRGDACWTCTWPARARAVGGLPQALRKRLIEVEITNRSVEPEGVA